MLIIVDEKEIVNAVIEKINVDINEQCGEIKGNSDMIFRLVLKAGEVLLHNGGEIFRVEQTMEIIAKHYGVVSIDVYAVSNGIFVTMSIDGNYFATQIKEVPIDSLHLGRVAEVNNLSRNIVAGKYSVQEAMEELKRIEKIPKASNWSRVLFAGIGSAAFCYMLGGSIYDSLVSFIAGLFLYLFINFSEGRHFPKALKIAIGASLVTFISILLHYLGMGDSLDQIIIGSIICLVPGVALTTSVRNFFNGDYLAGAISLVDTLLVATSISVGVSVMIRLWNYIL